MNKSQAKFVWTDIPAVILGAVFALLLWKFGQWDETGNTVATVAVLAANLIFFRFVYRYFLKIDALKALPEVEFPFARLYRQIAGYIFMYVVVQIFVLYLARVGGNALRFIRSPIAFIVIAFVLGYLVSSASQPIASTQEGIYTVRDHMKGKKRQWGNAFNHLHGHYRDGVIYGFMLFPYKEIEEVSQEKKAYVIFGKHDGKPWQLVFFRPKSQEYYREIIERRRKR